jgi:hypothetical protein
MSAELPEASPLPAQSVTSTTRKPGWRLTRDTVLFLAGLAGIGWETIFEDVDRPVLLLLFGAMVGLPAFLRVDEARAVRKDGEP